MRNRINDILIAANRYDADGNIRYIVRYEKLREWCEYHSYICGLQHVYYIYKPITVLGIYLGSKLVEIKKEPVNDLSIFAEMVKGFLGYPYVNDVEFTFAKWYAPDRFTCTTLAWYCAKSLYGIDISAGPLTSCISPLEVLDNIHVYTIYKIK